jgi:hypothetical protein
VRGSCDGSPVFRCEISFRTGYGGQILDVHWDLGKLHALPGLPEVEIPVKELAWHLGLPFWAVNGVPFQVCPQDVLDAPDRYRDQWARTLATDLSYPLHARVDPEGKVIMLARRRTQFARPAE